MCGKEENSFFLHPADGGKLTSCYSPHHRPGRDLAVAMFFSGDGIGLVERSHSFLGEFVDNRALGPVDALRKPPHSARFPACPTQGFSSLPLNLLMWPQFAHEMQRPDPMERPMDVLPYSTQRLTPGNCFSWFHLHKPWCRGSEWWYLF